MLRVIFLCIGLFDVDSPKMRRKKERAFGWGPFFLLLFSFSLSYIGSLAT